MAAGPVTVGSYREQDVSLLFADLTCAPGCAAAGCAVPGCMAAGRVPAPEYQPGSGYLSEVSELIASSAARIALLTATLGELILSRRGRQVVLVSIARAGTPVGVLLRRWFREHHGLEVPHYTVSISNGVGLDLNAVSWICRRHDPALLQFVDGWTSKGTVGRALRAAAASLDSVVDPRLAVLCDIGWCTDIFATRDDTLMPHACLGAAMSGLLSRTFAGPDASRADSFHAVVAYRELAGDDLSNVFLDAVSAHYPLIAARVPASVRAARLEPRPDYRGSMDARDLARRFGSGNLDLVNIGLSEAARAFFRRKPRLLIVKTGHDDQAAHLLRLAAARGVPVRHEPALRFRAALL